MIRKLLATTAIATLVASGAFAQATSTEEPAQATQPPATEAQPDAAAPDAASPDATAETTDQSDAAMADAGAVATEGHLASKLIGTRVYNGTNDDAENIGEVKDIVIGNDGKAEMVVIGVGGFLGIGEKDVALEYSSLEWAERDGDMWLVAQGHSKEQLEAAPEFDTAAYDPTQRATADSDVAATQPGAAPPATEDTAVTEPPADDTTAATEPPADDATTATEDTAGTEPPADDTTAATEPPADDATTATDDTAATEPTADDATAATDQPADDTTAATEPAASDDSMAAADQPADQATDETTTGAIDRSQLKEWDTSGISGEELIGTTVYGANDERVGEIGDIVLSQEGDQQGKVDAIIVDVGGFLGVGEKKVAVGMDNLQFMQDENGNHYLYTNFNKEQLEAQPAYDESSYAQNRDEQRMTAQ